MHQPMADQKLHLVRIQFDQRNIYKETSNERIKTRNAVLVLLHSDYRLDTMVMVLKREIFPRKKSRNEEETGRKKKRK